MTSKIDMQLQSPMDLPQEMVRSIVKAVDPEMILCYGVRSKAIEVWSCFLTRPNTEILSTFDLLIITREDDIKKSHEVVDLISYHNTPLIKVTAVVHKTTAVIEALKSGNPFFVSVLKAGHAMYERKGNFVTELEMFSAQASGGFRPAWNKFHELGQQFLKGACFSSKHGADDLSAFMLHQAVEHTSTALIRAATGYRPSTHNLGRIFEMLENFSAIAGFVFPRNTREEKDIFDLLASSYSDARYKPGFKVSKEMLSILIDRVVIFQNHAEAFLQVLVKNNHSASMSDPFEKGLSYEK